MELLDLTVPASEDRLPRSLRSRDSSWPQEIRAPCRGGSSGEVSVAAARNSDDVAPGRRCVTT